VRVGVSLQKKKNKVMQKGVILDPKHTHNKFKTQLRLASYK